MTPRTSLVATVLLAICGAAVGLGTHATFNARLSGDEPYYLLTAQSLVADGNLDIDDEIAGEEFRAYHRIDLDEQTIPLNDRGQRLSPHDPLLPVLLVPGTALGGWVGARLTLVVMAGATAAAAWVLARRLGAGPVAALVAIGGAACGLPLAGYGTQLYPELPAALAVTIAAAALVRRDAGAGAAWVTVGAAVALAWLGVKYVPVGAALVLAAAWVLRDRVDRTVLAAAAGVLALAGIAYLVAHQRIYGGWTVYAVGDHFVDDGEFAVVGTNVDLAGRSRRLVGLIVDRDYGLAAWTPLYLGAPAAIAVFARRPGPGRTIVLACLAAAWATATWVALTMHGWWVPGRQVIVVLPLVAAAMAATITGHRRVIVAAAIAGAAGALTWLAAAWAATTGGPVLIVDLGDVAAGWRTIADVWPDGRRGDVADDIGLVVAACLLAGTVVAARRATA